MPFPGDIERNAELVIERLTHMAPMTLTTVELMHETGLSRQQLQRAFKILRKPGARKVRIAGWERQKGSGDTKPKWGLGNWRDVNRIGQIPKSEHERRRRERLGLVMNAKRRSQRGAVVYATPFDGLMPR